MAKNNEDEYRSLHKRMEISIAKNDVKEVQALIDTSNININVQYGHKGNTFLIDAVVTMRSEEIITMLLEAGANVNLKNIIDRTALYYAIQRPNAAIVQKLFDYGGSIDDIFFTRCMAFCKFVSPVEYALGRGLYETAEVIVRHSVITADSHEKVQEFAKNKLFSRSCSIKYGNGATLLSIVKESCKEYCPEDDSGKQQLQNIVNLIEAALKPIAKGFSRSVESSLDSGDDLAKHTQVELTGESLIKDSSTGGDTSHE